MIEPGHPLTPDLALAVDGVPLAPETVLQARVVRALSVPARAEIVVETADFAPPLGATLTLGTSSLSPPLFEGTLTAVERARAEPGRIVVSLLAEDALAGLRTAQTPGAFADLSAAELAERLVQGLGLTVDPGDGADPRAPLRIARGGSDAVFLAKECQRVGLYFALIGGVVRLMSLEGGSPREIDLSGALTWRLTSDGAEGTEVVSATGAQPDLAQSLTAMAFGLSGGGSFGRAAVAGAGELALFGLAEQSEDLLLARASAEMTRRDAGRVVFDGSFEGALPFALGDALTLTGVAHAPALPLVVTRIENRFEATAGHVVTVSTRPPVARGRASDRMAWGTVSDNADPEGTGRLRCTLPGFAGAETGWLQLLRPLSGAAGGFAGVPSVGDAVLLLCPEGRPELSVVLGCLAGQTPLHLDPGDNLRLGLRTEGGQALALDDDTRAVAVETAGGTRLTLDPGGATLTAAGDLTLEAPGGTITIRAGRVDFEQV